MTAPDFTLDDDLDDEDQDQGNQGGNSGPMNEIRKQLREAKKLLKAQMEENAELKEFRATTEAKEKQLSVAEIAGKLGLSAKHAALLIRANPELELTEEAVRAAAIEEELLIPAEGEEAPAPVVERPFVPITAGGSVPTDRKLTREEWVKLQSTDMTRAMDLYTKGQVEGLESVSPRD